MSWCQVNRKRKRRARTCNNIRIKKRCVAEPHSTSFSSPSRPSSYNLANNNDLVTPVLPPPPPTIIKSAFMEGEEEISKRKQISYRGAFCSDIDIGIGTTEAKHLQDRKNPHKGFEHCSKCNELLHVIPTESRLVCLNCAESTEHVLAISNNIRYGNDTSSVVHVYLREKNFLAWLKQFEEGQEEIPDSVLMQVKQGLRTKHIKSSLEVRATPVAKMLKSLGLGKYIKKASRIAARLNQHPIPEFTKYEISQFLAMFRAIQVPFLLIKGVNRRNFLNASYLVCKFSESRGWGHFRIAQNMLKSRPVLIGQDQDWAMVCQQLNIPFYRSV